MNNSVPAAQRRLDVRVRLTLPTGAVIALDADRIRALEETGEALRMVLARARCKNISRQEIHDLIDEIYDNFY